MIKTLLLVLFAVALAVVGQVLLKLAMVEIGKISFHGGTHPMEAFKLALVNPLVYLGLSSYGASAVSWMVILSRSDLSYVYPMTGLSFILLVMISALFLGENVSSIRWLGTIVIVIGILLVARS